MNKTEFERLLFCIMMVVGFIMCFCGSVFIELGKINDDAFDFSRGALLMGSGFIVFEISLIMDLIYTKIGNMQQRIDSLEDMICSEYRCPSDTLKDSGEWDAINGRDEDGNNR